MTKQRRSRGYGESSSSLGVESSEKFEGLQVGRDLESNWEVDVAEKLQEYLLKICSGVVCSTEDINFAEAALLLQGSVQVYSRKVEYLYSLVLHTLGFLANKSQEVNSGDSATLEKSSHDVSDDCNEGYWEASEIPVEDRNRLEVSTSDDALRHHFLRPPASLVVIEGDYFDSAPDGEELESFLLGSTNLYRNFILLDPSDSASVDEYLKVDDLIGKTSASKGTIGRKSFISPGRKSAEKKHGQNHHQSPTVNFDHNVEDDLPDFGMDEAMDASEDEEDNPWKPLNPHEPGSLKVKPFAKVKSFRKIRSKSDKQILFAVLFPPVKVYGTISPEFSKIWESKHGKFGKSNSLYEKLRESLVNENPASSFCDHAKTDDHLWESADLDDDINDYSYVNAEPHEERIDTTANMDVSNKKSAPDDSVSQTNLEELCRSHLDVLLVDKAESGKQADLAARVSSWKQKIEHDLEEQDCRPPFDIRAYGETIISKLSFETAGADGLSFRDVVRGQDKHDVARTFSALLQLVNNGEVHLKTDGTASGATCYSAVNPFCVQLQNCVRDRRKRVNSSGRPSLKSQCEQPVVSVLKSGNVGSLTLTPEGKKRRKTRVTRPVGL